MTGRMVRWPRRNPDTPSPDDPPGDTIHERGMESARRTSSLPSGVFRARSPQVEQVLADGVAEVFLRHMSRVEGAADLEPPERAADQRHEGDEEITKEDRDALLAALREHADAPPPPLDEGIDSERTWVLLDLAVHGDTTARAAAVGELLDLAHTNPPFERHDPSTLRALTAALDRIMASERPSLVLNELRKTAELAIARAEGTVT